VASTPRPRAFNSLIAGASSTFTAGTRNIDLPKHEGLSRHSRRAKGFRRAGDCAQIAAILQSGRDDYHCGLSSQYVVEFEAFHVMATSPNRAQRA